MLKFLEAIIWGVFWYCWQSGFGDLSIQVLKRFGTRVGIKLDNKRFEIRVDVCADRSGKTRKIACAIWRKNDFKWESKKFTWFLLFFLLWGTKRNFFSYWFSCVTVYSVFIALFCLFLLTPFCSVFQFSHILIFIAFLYHLNYFHFSCLILFLFFTSRSILSSVFFTIRIYFTLLYSCQHQNSILTNL